MSKYEPSPDVSGICLSNEIMQDIEAIAKSVHDEWQRQRTKAGWGYAEQSHDENHPAMVPYEDLPEVEKDMDRATVLQTIRMLHHLGYSIHRGKNAEKR